MLNDEIKKKSIIKRAQKTTRVNRLTHDPGYKTKINS